MKWYSSCLFEECCGCIFFTHSYIQELKYIPPVFVCIYLLASLYSDCKMIEESKTKLGRQWTMLSTLIFGATHFVIGMREVYSGESILSS
jgi:hypothetical protein